MVLALVYNNGRCGDDLSDKLALVLELVCEPLVLVLVCDLVCVPLVLALVLVLVCVLQVCCLVLVQVFELLAFYYHVCYLLLLF